MKHSATTFFLGLALLAATSALPAQGPAGGEQKPQLEDVVGVVDFVKVFEAYPKAIKEQQRLNELDKSNKARIDARAADLDELQLQIAKLQRNTKERAELELQLKNGQSYLEGLSRIAEVEWQREYAKFLVEIYGDIEVAIQKLAKQKGLKLVLRRRAEAVSDAVVHKMEAFQKRNVWYVAEELDLTPAVIKLLQVPPAKPDPRK